MSVLKIKDQNGQWTDVLSIKGEKGDNGQDYVLTENDKQEIAQDVAELVDTDMVVTFTIPWVNGSFGEGGTADKTFAEIKTAVLEGKHVIGKLYVTANNTSQFLTTLPTVTDIIDAGDIITFSAYYSFGHADDFKTINNVITVFIGNDGTNDAIIVRQISEIATEEYVRERINAIPDAPVGDVQINGTSILQGSIANIPIADSTNVGVAKFNGDSYGIAITSSGDVYGKPPTDAQIKAGTNIYKPITSSKQHIATFYGLAKASGDTTQSQSSNAVGTYTDEAKTSIQSMLGVANKADKLIITIGTIINSTNNIYQIDNTYVNIASALRNGATVIVYHDPEVFPYVGMATIDNNPVLAFGTSTTFNGTAVLSGYLIMQNNTAMRVDQYTIIPTFTSQLTNDSLVEDVLIDGNSIVTDGVAEIPFANNSGGFGIVGISSEYGITINNQVSGHYLYLNPASSAQIKSGTMAYKAIVPFRQHESVFYGLAKAAGDTTQSTSSNAVGTYTSEAQTAIKQMLGVKDDYDSLVVEVSGTDPVITGKASYRYNCGELYTLSITPPESGTMDIIFTSGATPTVLTLPSTVKMPTWWAGIETNTIYEMCITDGVYCGVMSWEA